MWQKQALVVMFPYQRRGACCIWYISCQRRRCHDAFLCAEYLMNLWVDWKQIGMDITLGHAKKQRVRPTIAQSTDHKTISRKRHRILD